MAEPCTCHVCGRGLLEWVSGFEALPRVTSDCKPWPAGGELAVCRECGAVQKPVTEQWRREAEAIYQAYTIYHQSGGVEQAVFPSGNEGPAMPGRSRRVEPPETAGVARATEAAGLGVSRSDRLVARLLEELSLPATGRLLDVGCGNGALLRAFARQRPHWRLEGTEISDKYRDQALAIPGVEAMHTCPLADVAGRFDLVSLVHVLEHIAGPGEFVRGIAGKLAGDGRAFFELPCYPENPFDLLVADHCSHFTAGALARLLRRGGMDAPVVSTGWVTKELSAVATRWSGEDAKPQAASGTQGEDGDSELRMVARAAGWLGQVAAWAMVAAREGTVGVFGTSLAGTWITAILGDRIAFYVDEDPARVGGRFMGRRVVSPADVPEGSEVLVVLPPAVAWQIAQRLGDGGVRYHVPPNFT